MHFFRAKPLQAIRVARTKRSGLGADLCMMTQVTMLQS